MNRRSVFGLFAGLVLAGGCADKPTLSESASAFGGADGRPHTASVEDRNRITEFWSVYREATAHKQAGRWEQAAAGYTRSLQLDPKHWDSLYYLGNCLMELGRFGEAEEAYRRLAATDPQAARAYSALGALYSNLRAGSRFDLSRAGREYYRAWRANADESGSVLRLGEVAVAAGDMAKAEEYLQAASRTNFRSVSARFLRGYLAWSEGREKEAASLFGEAAALTKVQKPPAGVLGEGDTRLPGYRAMTVPGQRGLFDAFVGELWQNRDSSPARMRALYQRVRQFIITLPRRATAARQPRLFSD